MKKERTALKKAFDIGYGEGLRVAGERIMQYLEGLSGDRHDYLTEVIAGRLTAEMVLIQSVSSPLRKPRILTH
jgi:hypothetical protein